MWKQLRKNAGHFFLLAIAAAAIFGAGCGGSSLGAAVSSDYAAPVAVGVIEADDIKESSGLAASECQDVLWTHNDAGSEAVIFAMDLRGKHLGAWKVPNARNIDWESIAGYKDQTGKCFLIIADIGDNDAARAELQIYRIPEPAASQETAAARFANPLAAPPAETLKFTYADRPHNAETVLIHPLTGDIYIVTKEKKGPAFVHRIKPDFNSGTVVRTDKVADISMPAKPEGLLTGGSFAPDGRRVMLCDVQHGYELSLPANATGPEAIWAQNPVIVDLGDRKQGEGVSYARDGVSLYASSEKKNTPIYQIRRKTAQ